MSVPPSLRLKRMAEAVSGILPREDKATAMRVLSLSGKPSASRSGSAVSTLIRKVSGLRRYRPGRFLGEAAMTNAGPLAGRRRCIFPHVFAAVMALLQAAFRVAAHGAVDADPQGSRERRWSRGLRRGHGSRRRLTPRGGMFVGCRLKRRGSERPPHCPARHYPAWPCAARFVRASCSAAHPSPSRS